MSIIRRLALILWWGTLVLVVVGVLSLAVGWPGLTPGAWVGGALVGLGLNVLLAGDLVVGPEARPFSAHAQVTRGVLKVDAAWADVQVTCGDGERVAVVRCGPLARPDFEVTSGVARLHLGRRGGWLSVAGWEAGLAGNILWDIEARGLLGSLTLDLRHLRLKRARLHNGLGCLRVICPQRGFATLALTNQLGTVEVIVPPRVGVRLRLERGPLATVQIDRRRFRQLGPERYSTPESDPAEGLVDLVVRAHAGEVRIG
jgi:hypothetical protein